MRKRAPSLSGGVICLGDSQLKLLTAWHWARKEPEAWAAVAAIYSQQKVEGSSMLSKISR